MLELYFVYNGHCKFYLGTFDNVDELIEQMEDHQWAFSAITHPRFQKHIGQRTTRFDYGSKDCYYLATFFQEEKKMIELIKEFGMAILWLFLGYLVGERTARKEKKDDQ